MSVKHLVAALAIAALIACSKEQPSPAQNPAAKNAARGPAAAGNAKPAPPPQAKPQGPLPSQPGTRAARFELTGSGRILVTVLTKDRKDLEPIDAKELTCTVMGDTKDQIENIKLVARPAKDATDGKTAHFQGYCERLKQAQGAVVAVTFPEGEPKMARFDVPKGYKSY